MAYPFPLTTFLKRSTVKNRANLRLYLHFGMFKLGIGGAKHIGFAENGNEILKLNCTTPLGSKGKLLEIPLDNVISRSIRISGTWALDTCLFLAQQLNELALFQKNIVKTKKEVIDHEIVFLDIGANTGMVTLQVKSLASANYKVIMVEPLQAHVEAIKFNIQNLTSSMSLSIFPFALGKENGNSSIFTEKRNFGNTSLIRSVVPEKELVESLVKVVSTKEFCEKHLNSHDSYVIKSDLQGYDALVLARIPKNIWDQTFAVVVEIWALPEIEAKDVRTCLNHWQKFKKVNWTGKLDDPNLEFDEIANFWLSGSHGFRDLYLWK